MTAVPAADPAASPPSLLEGAIAAARRGGVREVWWRTLGVTVFRRLIVHSRPLQAGAAKREVPGSAFGAVEDAATYRALRPAVPAAEFEARRARGDWCAGAWVDGRLVAVRWMAQGSARLDYLGLEATLPPGVAYLYDAFTDPAMQGRGVNMALSREVDRRLEARGADTVFGAVLGENRAGMAFIRASPHMKVDGWLGVVRAGRRRFPVNRAPQRLVADLRPIGT